MAYNGEKVAMKGFQNRAPYQGPMVWMRELVKVSTAPWKDEGLSSIDFLKNRELCMKARAWVAKLVKPDVGT